MYILDIEKALKVYGSDTVARYDLFRFTSCLQGLLNREKPQLHILWESHDSFWLDYITSEGKFLHGETLVNIDSIGVVCHIFRDFIRKCGIVLWDEAVPSTLNAATTACGVDGYLPLRAGSLAEKFVRELTGAEVKLDLTGKFTGEGTVWETEEESTGSRKCDAYVWALNKYMDKTADDLLFFTLDGASWAKDRPYYPDMGNAFVPNMDYAVARKAFVFDLFSFDDEAPCDEPDQPIGTDYKTMLRIFRAQYDKTNGEKMTTLCGFNPWHVKYTTVHDCGKHEPVESEWHLSEILSAYNCVKDADAAGYTGLANASVYRHFPLKSKYKNKKVKVDKKGYSKDKTYILFYVGDYDAASWTARFIPRWYKDPALGKNPLMWCFNPNLSDRIPMAFDFIYNNYTDNDFFQAGDSGAGYNNPRLLYPPRIYSDLPSGVETNVAHNKKYFEKFDMSMIGFVINSVYKTDVYQKHDLARFATAGVGYLGNGEPCSIVNGVPFCPHSSDIYPKGDDPRPAAETAVGYMRAANPNKHFHIFRTILVSPTMHDKIYESIKELCPERDIELLDPYTFFEYLKIAVNNGDTY